MVHENSPIALDLMIRSHSKKDNLSKLLGIKRSKANASNDFFPLRHAESLVVAIKDKSHNVLFGHFWKLRRKNVLQMNKFLQTLSRAIIPNDLKF